MRYGVLSGALWGLDTVVLAVATALVPFLGAKEASLASAVLHDVSCALILLVYMGVRGRLGDTWRAARTRSGLAVVLGALLGGPIGMSGYLVAINNIGPGYTAIISTFYPAVGTFLAFVFLKERMHLHQVVALVIALAAIVYIGYSSTTDDATSGSSFIGVLGALACVLGWGSEAVILAWGMKNDVDNETALQIRETTSGLVYLLVVAPLAGVLDFTFHASTSLGTGVLALAAVAGTASYLFYYKAIDTIGASRGMALNISYSAWTVVFTLVLTALAPTLLDPTATEPASLLTSDTLRQVGCCVVILVSTVLAATPDWRELRFRRQTAPVG